MIFYKRNAVKGNTIIKKAPVIPEPYTPDKSKTVSIKGIVGGYSRGYNFDLTNAKDRDIRK